MHGGVVLALLMSTAHPAWVDDHDGGRCGPGNPAAEGEHAGVVTGEAPDWYDASSTTTRGYTVRGASPTSLGMLVYRWDGASGCVATGGAFSDVVRADFSLPPGSWQISIFANGASPGTYVLLGGNGASVDRSQRGH